MEEKECCCCLTALKGVRIKCAECSELDLCLQCFQLGAEIGSHKRDHKYIVKNDHGPIMFETDKPWTTNEETMLLDAVEQFGFGNWPDVANHVESRTTAECQEHYVTFYIHGNIGKVSFTADTLSKISDTTCPDGGPLSPSITMPLPPLELSAPEQQELGYMPFRDDFEIEYDNDAEKPLSVLSINQDDDDLELSVKLFKVSKFRLQLREREKRKRVVREYGLIGTGNKDLKNKKRKLSKEDRELQEKLKIFSQFHPAAEHERFFEDMQKEKEIKERLKELFKLRKYGLTTFDDVDDYEEEKYKREKKKENRKKMASAAQTKRNSMASKKAEGKVCERLDILIDDDDTKDDEDEEDSKEMAAFPGYDMLSERERKLCNSIGMTPANYITIKTCIIKDYCQRKQGVPVKIRYPSGMDKTHRRKIMGFLTDNGWIGVA